MTWFAAHVITYFAFKAGRHDTYRVPGDPCRLSSTTKAVCNGSWAQAAMPENFVVQPLS